MMISSAFFKALSGIRFPFVTVPIVTDILSAIQSIQSTYLGRLPSSFALGTLRYYFQAGFPEGHAELFTVCQDTVSYKHLDVYKRQI